MEYMKRSNNKVSAKIISVEEKTCIVEVPILSASPNVGENIIVTVPSTQKRLGGITKKTVQLSDVVARGKVIGKTRTSDGRINVKVEVKSTPKHSDIVRLKEIKNRNENVSIRTIGITPEIQ